MGDPRGDRGGFKGDRFTFVVVFEVGVELESDECIPFTFCSARSPSSFFKTDDPPPDDLVDIRRVDLELAHPMLFPLSLSLSDLSARDIFS